MTIPLNDISKLNYEGMKNIKSKTKQLLFPGGCSKQPDSPINGEIRCSIDR